VSTKFLSAQIKISFIAIVDIELQLLFKEKNNCDEFITISERWLIIYMVNEIWLLTTGNENADFVPIPSIFTHSLIPYSILKL